jgi:predicted nuclease of predicted toxin-antitoxin system
MRYLGDEDVDTAVSGLLANRGHDSRLVVQVLGSGSKDPVVRRYLRAMMRKEGDLTLITADNEFARRCGQEGSRLPCLWLRDLNELEYVRVRDLIEVIEREADIMGERFFMEIRAKSYIVRR